MIKINITVSFEQDETEFFVNGNYNEKSGEFDILKIVYTDTCEEVSEKVYDEIMLNDESYDKLCSIASESVHYQYNDDDIF